MDRFKVGDEVVVKTGSKRGLIGRIVQVFKRSQKRFIKVTFYHHPHYPNGSPVTRFIKSNKLKHTEDSKFNNKFEDLLNVPSDS